MFQGVAKVGAVNADEHKTLGAKYGVRGFPTIKIFGADKQKPEDYGGARTAQGFAEAAINAVRKKVQAQLGTKSSDRSDSKVKYLIVPQKFILGQNVVK